MIGMEVVTHYLIWIFLKRTFLMQRLIRDRRRFDEFPFRQSH